MYIYKHTSVLATIAKRTRAAPSPFSPLAPHRATATAKNSSEIAPEMGKKSRDTGKVDNGLKERLRANMKAKKKGTPCYAFGMALNPKMKSILGEEHRALLVVKSVLCTLPVTPAVVTHARRGRMTQRPTSQGWTITTRPRPPSCAS